jgi:hypothetical protein
MSWAESALWWLPTAAVAAVAVLGLVALAIQPAQPARRRWLGVLAACGVAATAASAWRQQAERAALTQETARLQELATRLDQVGRLLPAGPGATPDEPFGTVATAIISLNAKIKGLEEQIRILQEKSQNRAIDPASAAKIEEYLRPFGSHRVVVSCAPEDVEAYAYANQIATVLRAAGWDAPGVETTTIFAEAPVMGVRLYVRSGVAPPGAAKILIDAFTRFNIPYESGITPSEAIPDPATTELFISKKP